MIFVKNDLTPEEKAIKKKENQKRYLEKHRIELNEKSKIYYQENKDYYQKYREVYYMENKEDLLASRRERYQENKESISKRRKELRNRPEEKEKRRLRYEREKDNISEKRRIEYLELKEKIYKILGKKCNICGITTEKYLTLDHKNGGGRKDRKASGGKIGILRRLRKNGWSKKEIISEFQILCFNCNCSRGTRDYFDIDPKFLNVRQCGNIKIWKEAYNFFGGKCEICGETEIKYLTIDHRNKDGAERRRNGEGGSVRLLRQFRKLKWNESIRNDFRMLCYNCNCSQDL